MAGYNNIGICWCGIVIAGFFVNYLTVTNTHSVNCEVIKFKQEYMNKVLYAHYIGLYTEKSIYFCALRCMKVYGCLSMTYNFNVQGCLLHNVESSSVSSDDFAYLGGCVYSDFADWNLKNVCSGHTCAQDEMCLPIGSRYVCKKSSNKVCQRWNSTYSSCAWVHIGHNLFELGIPQYNSTENENP